MRRSRRAMSSDCKAGYGKRGLVAESGTGQRDHSCLDHLLVGLLSGSGTKRTIRVHTCSFRVLIPPVLIINTFSPSYLTFNIPVTLYNCHPIRLSHTILVTRHDFRERLGFNTARAEVAYVELCSTIGRPS